MLWTNSDGRILGQLLRENDNNSSYCQNYTTYTVLWFMAGLICLLFCIIIICEPFQKLRDWFYTDQRRPSIDDIF